MTDIESRLIEQTYIEVYIHGYKEANTTTILKNANVNKGSMYHYFRDKKALVLAALNHKLLPLVQRIYTLNESISFDDMVKLVKNSEMIVQKHGNIIVNLSLEMSGIDEDFAKILHEIHQQRLNTFEQMITQLKNGGSIVHTDANQLARFIIATIDGAAIAYKRSNQIADYFDPINELINYLTTLKERA
jgi:TetR/AcrR family transcriptional repressor of nem operon